MAPEVVTSLWTRRSGLSYGIMVFAIAGERIAGITGFAGDPELFTFFELPTELD